MATHTLQNSITSPRLAALQQALQAGDAHALEAFWQEIAAQGAPLIEALPDDPEQSLLTFLWRTTEEMENVVVVGGPAGWDFASNQMTRLPETDLWYKSYRARNDMRTMYRLAPNDPLTPPEEVRDFEARTAHFQHDPLNPHTLTEAPDEEISARREVIHSVLELPGAPPQPWSARRPDAPAGKVEMHRLRSEILDNERRVWVYTPPGYVPDGEPCHLLIIFDGWGAIHWIPAPPVLDNLQAEGLIPPLVAVMPDSLGELRNLELPCHPPFAEFLAGELLPWVRQHYAVTSDPAQTVVSGASYGGLASSFAALQHPELFGNVLSMSGSYWWTPPGESEHEWLTRQYVAAEKLPLRFYLDVGLLEVGNTPGDGPSQVVVNRHMRDVLQAKGYPVHYAEFNGGHDYVCWQGTMADGLLALIGKEKPKSLIKEDE